MFSARVQLALFVVSSTAVAQTYVISTVAGGAPPPTPIAGVQAAIGVSFGVTSDSDGSVYFTSQECVFRLAPNGVLTRVAGNSRPGYSGDGGLATEAQFNNAAGLAVDRSGNLYIADAYNHRIRKVSPSGIITTVAGTGYGFSGDGGPATSAKLSGPAGVAVDGSGNLYIADTDNDRVRKVSPSGVITTAAGIQGSGYSGDGGPATSARLYKPRSLALDPSGNLYIADSYNNRVRKVSPGGVISTLAGTGTAGFSGDGGPAASARLDDPVGVALDAQSNVYIADIHNQRVRRVSPGGMITTVAGSDPKGASRDDGVPATSAMVSLPSGVSVDPSGNLYIADSSRRIRKVSPGGIITTVAGTGGHYSGDGGPAAGAQLYSPSGVAADDQGNLYIADTVNYRVRKVSPGGIITTVAGTGTAGFSGDGGLAVNSVISPPDGVAVDTFGSLYIAEGARVRKVSPGGIITTVAGTGTAGYSGDGDGGPATAAQLYSPDALAFDGAGNLYITEQLRHCVRKVSPGGIITTVAGTGTAGFSGDGGPAARAQLRYPQQVAADGAGNVYIADSSNFRVRKVSTEGIITTVAGTGSQDSSGDGGPATSAHLSASGVAVDASGNLYIADYRRVRKVSASGIITTIAGNGEYSYSGDGGPATSATFQSVSNLAADRFGNLYVVDSIAHAIRMLRPAAPVALAILTSSPMPPGAVGVSYSQKLNAAGGVSPYTWSLSAVALPAGLTLTGGGTLSGTPTATGVYNFTVMVRDSGSGSASKDLRLTVYSHPVSAPAIDAGRIVNAASNAAGKPVTAGSLVSIYGANLANAVKSAGSIPLPTSLDEVSVTFNDVPAPLMFVSPGQINAQVPWNVLPSGTQEGSAAVVVTRGGLPSAPVTVAIGPFSPGIFTVNYGTGNAIAINSDGTLAAPSGSIPGIAARPANVGDPKGLVILATGTGALDSPLADGQNSADKVRRTLITPEVWVGRAPVRVDFSGASPEFVGVNQINVTLPSNVPTGDKVPLQLWRSGVATTDQVTISVMRYSDQIILTPADTLKVTGQAGQLNPSSHAIMYTLQNNLASAIPFTLSSSADWITLSKSAGTLPPNGNDSFTVSLNSNVNSLGAGSYSATVTFAESTYGTTITRTVTVNLSSDACVNIAGQWLASQTGKLTCTVTVNGESATETDPISGVDIVTITQHGCDVSYTSPSIMAAFGAGPSPRQGQVTGTSVKFSGIMGQLAPGFTYDKNNFEESGTIENDVIHLTGSGALAGSGVWQGKNTTFSCTAASTATMKKLP